MASATKSITCHRCRYDLEGLADSAPCPECGLRFAAKRARRIVQLKQQPRSPKWIPVQFITAIIAVLTAVIGVVIGQSSVRVPPAWIFILVLAPYVLVFTPAYIYDKFSWRLDSGDLALSTFVAMTAITLSDALFFMAVIFDSSDQAAVGFFMISPVYALLCGVFTLPMAALLIPVINERRKRSRS